MNVGGSESGMPKSFFYPQWKGNPPIEGLEGEYLTDRLTDEAVKFIQARIARDPSFFTWRIMPSTFRSRPKKNSYGSTAQS